MANIQPIAEGWNRLEGNGRDNHVGLDSSMQLDRRHGLGHRVLEPDRARSPGVGDLRGDARAFTLFAQGEGKRTVRVSYVLEAPVWKATYRILLDEANPDRKVGGDATAWSLKRLHKLVMLSRTYQQASAADEANAKIDVANDYLWKFDRRRLVAGFRALDGRCDADHAGGGYGKAGWRPHQHMVPAETTGAAVLRLLRRAERGPLRSVTVVLAIRHRPTRASAHLHRGGGSQRRAARAIPEGSICPVAG